jgi:hypothetical protein
MLPAVLGSTDWVGPLEPGKQGLTSQPRDTSPGRCVAAGARSPSEGAIATQRPRRNGASRPAQRVHVTAHEVPTAQFHAISGARWTDVGGLPPTIPTDSWKVSAQILSPRPNQPHGGPTQGPVVLAKGQSVPNAMGLRSDLCLLRPTERERPPRSESCTHREWRRASLHRCGSRYPPSHVRGSRAVSPQRVAGVHGASTSRRGAIGRWAAGSRHGQWRSLPIGQVCTGVA